MKLRIAASLVALAALPAAADDLSLNPVADGTVYNCAGCNTVFASSFITVGGAAQGVLRFASSPLAQPFAQALLSVNLYELPYFGPEVAVYGYTSAQAAISLSDVDAGSLLGTLTLPPGLLRGQDVVFDVTGFVQSQIGSSPFISFNLRAADANLFSSIEFNRGHPSQLTLVSVVPEPASAVLAALGLGLLLPRLRRSGP